MDFQWGSTWGRDLYRPSTITYMKTSLRRIDDFNGGLMISMGPSPSSHTGCRTGVVSNIIFFHPEAWGNGIEFDGPHFFHICW